MNKLLHPDWKKIVRHAWSMRFMGVALLMQVPQAFVQMAPTLGPYMPAVTDFLVMLALAHPTVLSVFSILALAGALLSRIVPQSTISGE